MSKPRIRLDVCCNDPDNGVFANRAEQLELITWDGETIQLASVRDPAPRFAALVPGSIRLCRRNWPTLSSKEWYGNWCWNAYWMHPERLIDLLAAIKKAGQFHCDCGPSLLYANWNDAAALLDRGLWLANLVGRTALERSDDSRAA